MSAVVLMTLMLCAGRAAAQQGAPVIRQSLGVNFNVDTDKDKGLGIRYTVAWRWVRLAPQFRFLYGSYTSSTSFPLPSGEWSEGVSFEVDRSAKSFGTDLQLVAFYSRRFNLYPFASCEYILKSDKTLLGGGLGVAYNFPKLLTGYAETRLVADDNTTKNVFTLGLALQF